MKTKHIAIFSGLFVALFVIIGPSIWIGEQKTGAVRPLDLIDINFVPEQSKRNVSHLTFKNYKVSKSGDINSKNLSLKDFKGKPIIVHFWATWCPPCVQEMPHYNDFLKEIDGVYHITIPSAEATPETIKHYYDSKDLNKFYISTDATGTFARMFSIGSLPSTVFINAKGEVVGKIRGKVDWQNQGVQKLIKKNLKRWS